MRTARRDYIDKTENKEGMNLSTFLFQAKLPFFLSRLPTSGDADTWPNNRFLLVSYNSIYHV
jgi:hypothetical protein